MIDWDRVMELCDEIGAEDFHEVVELFLTEVEETLDRMRTNDGPETLQPTLHFLKGSALNLGFSKLATLCQEGERACAAGQADGVDPAVLRRSYADAKHQFLNELPGRLAA